MNERIKKLANQAGAYISLSDELEGELILVGDERIKKFAELVWNEGYRKGNDDGWTDKEYIGV
jgi:hypothetical protein